MAVHSWTRWRSNRAVDSPVPDPREQRIEGDHRAFEQLVDAPETTRGTDREAAHSVHVV